MQGRAEAHAWVDALVRERRHMAIIPVGAPDRIALNAVAFARTLRGAVDSVGNGGHPGEPTGVEVVHVTDDHDDGARVVAEWNALRLGVPMVVLESPYRETAEALLRYIDLLQHERGPNVVVTVVLPETLPTRWWHPLLHNYLAWRLKWALLFRRGTCVLSVPYFVRD